MFGRKPPLKSIGTDPDYRFTLANEAHVPGVGPHRSGPAGGCDSPCEPGARLRATADWVGMTILLLVLSLTITVGAYVRWDGIERALREQRQLPTDPLPRLLSLVSRL